MWNFHPNFVFFCRPGKLVLAVPCWTLKCFSDRITSFLSHLNHVAHWHAELWQLRSPSLKDYYCTFSNCFRPFIHQRNKTKEKSGMSLKETHFLADHQKNLFLLESPPLPCHFHQFSIHHEPMWPVVTDHHITLLHNPIIWRQDFFISLQIYAYMLICLYGTGLNNDWFMAQLMVFKLGSCLSSE